MTLRSISDLEVISLQDTTFTSLKSLLNILKCSTREFSLAPNVLFFVLILSICMFYVVITSCRLPKLLHAKLYRPRVNGLQGT